MEAPKKHDRYNICMRVLQHSAFCGYKVAYDSMGARLTLFMPQKTKEAAHEHLPGLLEESALAPA